MRALEIAFKDVKTVARDYKALAIIIAMPIILIVILGAALKPMFVHGDRVGAFKVALVDVESDDVGTYVRELFASDQLKNLIYLVDAPTEESAREAILKGEVASAIVLPSASAGSEPKEGLEIKVLGDPADSVRPEIVRGIVNAFAGQYSAVYAATGNVVEAMVAAAARARVALGEEAVSGLVSQVSGRVTEATLASRTVLAQSTMDSKWISAPQYYTAGMSTMFVLFGGMLGVKSILEERKMNTMARLFATRATKADILLGKTLATFLICLLQVLILIGFTWGVLKVDWGGPVLAVLGVAVTMSFAATGFAMLIGALAKSERMADGLENIGVQVMSFLGGCQMPLYIFPAFLHPISKLTLTRWGLQGFLGIMEGQGFQGALQPMLVLTAMGAVFLGIGLKRIRLE